MITREEWNDLPVDHQWALFNSLQSIRQEQPLLRHFKPKLQKPKPEIVFTEQELDAPLTTLLLKKHGGLFSTKIVNGLIRTNRERLPKRRGLAETLTLEELIAACQQYGIEFWQPFAMKRDHGYITLYTVLKYLAARKALSSNMLGDFELITTLVV